jgi:hypothetical protein
VLFVLTGVEQKMQEEKRKKKKELLEDEASKKEIAEPSESKPREYPRS